MRSSILIFAPALLLAGCLTTQENPNYEISSKYQQPGRIQTAQTSPAVIAPTTQSVPYSAPVQTVTYETQSATQIAPTSVLTHGSTSTVLAANDQAYTNPAISPTIGTTQTSVPATAHAATTTYGSATTYPSENIAPTDAQFTGQEVTGTPGFMVLAQSNQTHTVQTSGIGQPQPVAYDHSQNFITADVVMENSDFVEDVRIIPSVGQSYIVQQGDTIYALSRRYCVGVDIIRSMNGIGADYAINIGQTITLPASHC